MDGIDIAARRRIAVPGSPPIPPDRTASTQLAGRASRTPRPRRSTRALGARGGDGEVKVRSGAAP
jgi:hypothetical protein